MGGPSSDEGISTDSEGREWEGEEGGEEEGEEKREKGGYKRKQRTEINWFHLAYHELGKIGHPYWPNVSFYKEMTDVCA